MIPYEYDEQCALVQWLENMGLKFTAIPNSTWTPSHGQKTKNRNSGLRPGFPDLLIILPADRCITGRASILCIEMKRIKDSVTSDEQIGWIEALNGVADCEAVICYGFDQAKKLILSLIH